VADGTPQARWATGALDRFARYEEDVESPSDFQRVEYEPLDGAGAWKAKILDA